VFEQQRLGLSAIQVLFSQLNTELSSNVHTLLLTVTVSLFTSTSMHMANKLQHATVTDNRAISVVEGEGRQSVGHCGIVYQIQ